jgi:hypothetical protein
VKRIIHFPIGSEEIASDSNPKDVERLSQEEWNEIMVFLLIRGLNIVQYSASWRVLNSMIGSYRH